MSECDALILKAQLLQMRRRRGVAVGDYVRRDRTKLLLLLVAVAITCALLALNQYFILAAIVGGGSTGFVIRDFQWYQRLAKEWQTSHEFIDWTKVETVAERGRNGI